MQREYCHVEVKGGVENNYGKVNILLQSFVTRGLVDTFSLVSDMNYVSQVSSPLPPPPSSLPPPPPPPSLPPSHKHDMHT